MFKHGWIDEKDLRPQDSDEDNMREAGFIEVIDTDSIYRLVEALRYILGRPIETRAKVAADKAIQSLPEKYR